MNPKDQNDKIPAAPPVTADPPAAGTRRPRGRGLCDGKIDRERILRNLDGIRAVARQRRNGAICLSLPDKGQFARMGLLGTPQKAGRIWWLQIKSRWLAEQLGDVTPARSRKGPRPAPAGPVLDASFPAWSLAVELSRFADKSGLDRKRQAAALRLAAAAIEAELGS